MCVHPPGGGRNHDCATLQISKVRPDFRSTFRLLSALTRLLLLGSTSNFEVIPEMFPSFQQYQNCRKNRREKKIMWSLYTKIVQRQASSSPTFDRSLPWFVVPLALLRHFLVARTSRNFRYSCPVQRTNLLTKESMHCSCRSWCMHACTQQFVNRSSASGRLCDSFVWICALRMAFSSSLEFWYVVLGYFSLPQLTIDLTDTPTMPDSRRHWSSISLTTQWFTLHPLHTKEGEEISMFLVPCLQSSISTLFSAFWCSFFAIQLALVSMITITLPCLWASFAYRGQSFSVPAESSGAPAESSGYTLRFSGDLTCGHFRGRRGEAEKPKNQRSLHSGTGRSITVPISAGNFERALWRHLSVDFQTI